MNRAIMWEHYSASPMNILADDPADCIVCAVVRSAEQLIRSVSLSMPCRIRVIASRYGVPYKWDTVIAESSDDDIIGYLKHYMHERYYVDRDADNTLDVIVTGNDKRQLSYAISLPRYNDIKDNP